MTTDPFTPEQVDAYIAMRRVRRGRAPSAIAARAGTCQKGHPRTPENSWRSGDRLICKPCRQAWLTARRAA